MKYYLYELGENLNNILSTESVSPCSFYKNREFGYKFLENRSFVHLDNVILLFSKPVVIKSRSENFDARHFPVIIEISQNSIDESVPLTEISNKCKGLPNDVKVFTYPKTIFFSALKDKFIFRNNDEFLYALNLSAKSIETKMYAFYERCGAFVKSFSLLNYVFEVDADNIVIGGIPPYSSNLVEDALKDKFFDRIKGAVYGYFFGLAASLPEKQQQSWNLYTQIKNYEALSINQKKFSKYIELSADNLKENLPNELLPYLENYIKALKNYVISLSKANNEKKSLQLRQIYDGEKSTLDDIFRKYIHSIQIKRRSFGPEYMPKVYENGKVVLPYINTELSKYDRKLVNDVVNLILHGYVDLSAEGSDEKAELIKKISSECLIPLYSKEVWNRTKQISKVNQGINEFRLADDVTVNLLLHNVLNSSPFDFTVLNNKPNLLSLCASLSSMTKDILAYSRHLSSLNISDLSVPFCLWGALYGFSAFDKRYSESFYLSENFEDLKVIYSNLLANGKIYSDFHYDNSLFSQDDAVRHDIANQIVNSMELGVSKLSECYVKQTKSNNISNDEFRLLKIQYDDVNNKLGEVELKNTKLISENLKLEQENKALQILITNIKKCDEKKEVEQKYQINSEGKNNDIKKETLSTDESWSDFLNKITKKENPKSVSILEKNFKLLKLKDNSKSMTVAKKKELYHEILNILKESSPQNFEKEMKEKCISDDIKNLKLIEELIYSLIKEANIYAEDKYARLLSEFCFDFGS